ncbi:BTB/POZ domain-containing protein [Ditylenchus destructor]|uniref:BTB/POZ domain-containing protein n=1 Tax=Ditylenchus destructor TaxID=166010 RepID=A0AAD4QU85_9BILA|nr:BTB/POZ domain-containing protein [Ditylenchus destructor]
MSGNISTPNNSDLVRLNVGGKTFQTSKDTLSRYPESFLARLVNGALSSEKDETGAFLIDRDPQHFRVILNYLRNGELVMDRNEIAVKELLREADFYGLHALVEEINNPIRSYRTEVITLCTNHDNDSHNSTTNKVYGTICFSEPQEDYKVLQALRDRTQLQFKLVRKGRYDICDLTLDGLMEIQTILRGFGFVQESYETDYDGFRKCWKFILQPTALRTEAITICDSWLTYNKNASHQNSVIFSETQDDYEVLQALRDRTQYNLAFVNKGRYSFDYYGKMEFETILRSFDFVQESYHTYQYYDDAYSTLQCWKYVRTVNK